MVNVASDSITERITRHLQDDRRIVLVDTLATGAYYGEDPFQEVFYLVAPQSVNYDPYWLQQLNNSLLSGWPDLELVSAVSKPGFFDPPGVKYREVCGRKVINTSGNFRTDELSPTPPQGFSPEGMLNASQTVEYVRRHWIVVYPTAELAQVIASGYANDRLPLMAVHQRLPMDIVRRLRGMPFGTFDDVRPYEDEI